jgi:hypothetical protein
MMARRNKQTTSAAHSTQVVPVEFEHSRTSGGWLLVHGLPLATPLIGCAIYAGLIALAHTKWGGDPVWTPLLSILLLLVGGLVTFFGWMSAGPRVLLRVLMVVTGTLATATLVLGLIVGMGAIWPGYILCSLIVSLLWTIWRGTKYAGATPATVGEGNALLDAIKAAKVQFAQPTVDERGVIRAKVIAQPGGTLEGARALLPHLSAAAQAVPGGTNLAGDPRRDGVGELEIPTRDNLDIPGGVRWPGVPAEQMGALPTVPFALGEYQTEPCMICLVGDYDLDPDAEDIGHLKIGGVTGSGKSICARTVLASLSVRRRLNIIGIDVSKGLQTFGPVAHGLTWVITDMNEARRFMKRLRKVIAGRSDQLTREGLMRWSLRSSLNLLLIWVEESSDFAALSADYENLLAKARSAGIMVVSSLQRITYRSMSTDARANHTAGICFGVDDEEDAKYVLPQPALAALGKNLPTWGVTRRGYAYVAGLGVPARKWSRMQRVYNATAQQLIDTVDAGAAYRDSMDTVTAELFGELYTQRTHYTHAVWGPGSADAAPAARPMPAAAAEMFVPAARPGPAHPAAPTDEEEMATMAAKEETEHDRQNMHENLADSRRRYLGEDARPADLADVDPEGAISGVIVEADNDGDDVEDEQETPRPSTEQAQRVFDEALDAWYREGRESVRTADLVELLGSVQRSRRFLYRQIDRWSEAEYISARPDADGWDLIASPMETAAR